MQVIWEILTKQGVTQTEIDMLKHLYILLSMLPVVVTLVGIARHIIGIKSLSLYAPIVLTFAFYELGYKSNGSSDIFEGLRYGITIYGVSFITSTLAYRSIKSFRMHYLPKISLVLLCVSIAIMLLVFIAVYFNNNSLIYLDTFSLIMVATASEGFISVYARKNFKFTAILGVDTLALATLAYVIISWQKFEELLLDYPPLILVIVLLNIYIGRFTGLRISEYFRFRKLLLSDELASERKDK